MNLQKAKPLTRTELFFIWKSIGELKAYLHKSIEAGAEGTDKDWDNACKAQDLVLNERRRLLNTKKKNK